MRHHIAAFALVVLSARLVHAADPVCALLAPGNSPRAALLEARLLAGAGATWVERNQIDKAIGEQKLQAAFGPQGVGERVKLGRLLKAEVLVLVREVRDAGEATLEVVVGETGAGLRLLVRGVPVTRDADADVAALLAAVRDGLRKHGEKITDVIAVPPFVTRDLEFEHDHLKGAYARLTEAAALGRRGVVVVELEEAEALARELTLTAPGVRIERPPPVYLLGEYRNEGRGAGRTVALSLRAERGGRPIGLPLAVTARPDTAPARLRTWAAGVLDALAADDTPRPAADPKAEAALLAGRALAFRRLGYRREALALTEASLLLNPDQPTLHIEAFRHLCWLASSAFGPAANQRDVKRAAGIAPPYRRALAHLEDYANTAGGLPDYATEVERLELELRRVAGDLVVYPHYRAALEDELLRLREERRAVYLRIIPTLARRADRAEVAFVWTAVRDLPRKRRYDAVEALVVALDALPDPRARAVSYICTDRQVPADRPEFRALLARWAGADKPYLRAAAAELRAKLEAPIPSGPPVVPGPETDPTAPGPGAVALKPIRLDTAGGSGSMAGGMAVGPATDLVWTERAVFLMTEKGKLRPVWRETGSDRPTWNRFSSVSFDGKYVWATCERTRMGPVLLVIDPASGTVWDGSTAGGLPRPPVRGKDPDDSGPVALMVQALGPGRACLAGWFSGRLWVGVAALDPAAGTVAVKVTHEAREVPDPDDKEQWKKTTVGCRPTFMSLLTGPPGADGRPVTRVLLGRTGGAAHGLTEHPLVVRPDGAAEGALGDRMWNPPSQGTSVVVDGALYYLELYSEGQTIRTHLARVGLPGPAKTVLVGGLPKTPNAAFRVTTHGGKAHAIIEQWKPVEQPRALARTAEWWSVDLDGKNPKRVATGLPGMRAVWTSAHYGLVALVDHGLNAPPVLNTVEFVAVAPKTPERPGAVPDRVVSPRVGDSSAGPPKPAPKRDPVAGPPAGREPVAGDERAVEVAPGVKMVFCFVPAGETKLGSSKAERAAVLKAIDDDREPGWLRAEGEEARGVFRTKGFWLGKYEVTQAEWAAVMGANPSYYDGQRQNPAKGLETDRFPVDSVSWDACQKFLGAVNRRADASGAFGRAGRFCLPHEDEWEYACRGGKGNARPFYWGGEWNGTQANSHGYFPFGTDRKGPALARPAQVGSYEKNWPHPWGLCDMHGNVWEWCENEFDDVTNLRVLRGGAHSIYPVRGRAAARNRYEPFLHSPAIGFRVCFRPAE